MTGTAFTTPRRMTPSFSAADILAHPRFAEARLAHIDAIVEVFQADRFASRMMFDVGMIMLRGFLVGFHFTFDAGDRATWATPGAVRDALIARNLASPRRVDDLLARFRQAGYVVPQRRPPMAAHGSWCRRRG